MKVKAGDVLKAMTRLKDENARLKEAQRERPGIGGGSPEIGLSRKEKKRFSWGKLFIHEITGDKRIAEFELECQKAAKAADPWYATKTAQFTNDTNLGWLVTPEFMDQPIDLLRSAKIRDQLPMQKYVGLRKAPFVKTRITGEGSAGWGPVGEGTAATQTDGSVDRIQAFPHRSYAARQLSLELVEQGPQAAEEIVRRGILETHGRLIDKGVIEGSGVSGQPIGVNNISGISTVAFTSATADEKLQKLREMIWKILTANVPGDGLVWVMHPLVLSNLDRIIQSTSAATAAANLATGQVLGMNQIPSLDGGPIKWTLGGIPVVSTTNLTASTTTTITLASWPQISYYEWGSPVVRFSKEGKTNTLANEATMALFLSVDVNADHPEAICTGTAFTY